jgi:2-oxoglutarate dehydrogenase E2 component (dihydrolipoamide succinyltransferase)
MAQFEIIMPKMGESITEATITKWFVKAGDKVEEDDVLLEIATDKVDSEIPSPVEGVVKKVFYQQDEVVAVGAVIAIIDLDGNGGSEENEEDNTAKKKDISEATELKEEAKPMSEKAEEKIETKKDSAAAGSDDRFYSPLVKKIAKEENISSEELASIKGSGLNERVQKTDILAYLEKNKKQKQSHPPQEEKEKQPERPKAGPSLSAGDEIVEMDRMRKLISEHMIRSKQVSAHVTNMLEVDVTNIVHWRNKNKDEFEKREGVKLTYLPVFLEASVKALKDFPMINSSVDNERIIIKKKINLGIAVSLPNYNLIVPVIKDADQLNLVGLTNELNRLADAARNNRLKPDEIQGGTFTVTNFGSFRNTIGTPIINQPQVAILAIGVIEKKPAVLETADGDVIAIRHKMYLSLTYDHRIIDGSLGGSYLRKVADYIEAFDSKRII